MGDIFFAHGHVDDKNNLTEGKCVFILILDCPCQSVLAKRATLGKPNNYSPSVKIDPVMVEIDLVLCV